MTEDVARILPSASLLLAVLAVMMNMWNKDVIAALGERTGAEDDEQMIALRKKLRRALLWKAGPLALAGALIFFVFLPVACHLLKTAWACWGDDACLYDPVAAAFLATYALIGLIFLVLLVQALRLLYAMRPRKRAVPGVVG